jgi:polysaccharide biosynthesis/export protein
LGLVRKIKEAGRWIGLRPALVLSSALMVSGAAILSGCEAYNQAGEINSFFDPTEPNIRPLHSVPLVKPVLDTLDPSIEEPDDLFTNATDVEPADLVPDEGDYHIGKNDIVSITVYDLLGEGTGPTTRTVRVSESGQVALDFIKPVTAEGLTEQELQDAVVKAYSDAGQIRNARVSVSVTEEEARIFSIYGNVGGEGPYQILRNDFRVLDALIIGKGPANPEGVEYCYVIRQPVKPKKAAPPAPAPTDNGNNPSEPPAPSDLQPPPAPTTQLLEPPHSRANFSFEPRMMSAAGDTSGLLAPDNQPPTGVVEGKPAPAAAPADNSQPAAVPAAPTDTTSQPPASFPPSDQGTGNPGEPGGLNGFQFNGPSPYDQRVIRVPLRELRNGRLEYNIVIRPGDLIFVPDPVTGEFYMGGHVARTGPYSLTGRKIDLKMAIISAGMFDQVAIPGRCEVIRRIGEDKEVFVRVDIAKIFAGEQPDIYLKPNDQVLVGTNEIATFLAAFRNAYRITYGFGFTYDQNFAPVQPGSNGQ